MHGHRAVAPVRLNPGPVENIGSGRPNQVQVIEKRRVSLQGDRRPADNRKMEEAGTPVLALVCPHCGEAFPSVMQMDQSTFAQVRLESALEHCSACGKVPDFGRPITPSYPIFEKAEGGPPYSQPSPLFPSSRYGSEPVT